MAQCPIYPDPWNIDLITRVPNFANEVSQKIARGECNVIPSFSEISYANWHNFDLVTAFNNARSQIEAVTAPGQKAFHTLAGLDIRRKWCLPRQHNSFQGMQNWSTPVLKIVLFDIWRDLMWVKYDGLDDIIIGVTVDAYGTHQYSVPPFYAASHSALRPGWEFYQPAW